MLKSYFAVTDKGPYFNNNQDVYFANLDYNIFGVIDGFGGTGIGDVIANRVSSCVSDILTTATNDQDATLKYFYDSRRSVECNFLINGLLKLHNDIQIENEQKSIYQRGGASCVFLIASGSKVTVISIGKIYSLLIRNESVRKIVHEDDGLSFESDNLIASTNSWTKSGIGLFSPLQYSIKEFNVLVNDQVLLASIGAVNNLEINQLASRLSSPNAKQVTTDLLASVNELGNRDNQTAILLKF